jgi:hypothetical protein
MSDSKSWNSEPTEALVKLGNLLSSVFVPAVSVADTSISETAKNEFIGSKILVTLSFRHAKIFHSDRAHNSTSER